MAQSPSCAALLSQCGDHPGHANWDGSPTRAYSGALVAIGLPGGCGVKDSFCALDLAALGFQPLFDATWLWRAPSELAQWETAWSGSPANNPSSEHPRLFLPALLADPELVFIVAYRHQDVVAGAIAHHTDGVVGLSNVFVPPDAPVAGWAGCVAMAQECFPGVAMVGYEHGPALALAQEIGF